MMIKTVREQIIQRIVAQLGQISREAGYSHDIGTENIYRQESVIEQGKVPGMTIWELVERRERNQYGGTVKKLGIKIEGVVLVESGEHPAEVSNQLLGDIEKALIIGDISLDELIDDIQDTSAEIITLPYARQPLADTDDVVHLPLDRQLAGAIVSFEIAYTTEWGDPYTQ